MKIALIQAPLYWENPTENRSYFQNIILNLAEKPDLIVLPEMFTTGFTMQAAAVAETMDGATVLWMKTVAKSQKCALVGSLVITENDLFFNRLLFVFPDGKLLFYDKKHLFTLAGEHAAFTAGSSKLVVDYMGFKICPLICYDLRFPVFSRNTTDYDVLIYVANWPKTRINAWDVLLKARAIENMSYVLGVNRIGTDDHNLVYTGHTQAVDFLGENLIAPQETEAVFVTTLDLKKLNESRQKLGFLNDKDAFLML